MLTRILGSLDFPKNYLEFCLVKVKFCDFRRATRTIPYSRDMGEFHQFLSDNFLVLGVTGGGLLMTFASSRGRWFLAF